MFDAGLLLTASPLLTINEIVHITVITVRALGPIGLAAELQCEALHEA